MMQIFMIKFPLRIHSASFDLQPGRPAFRFKSVNTSDTFGRNVGTSSMDKHYIAYLIGSMEVLYYIRYISKGMTAKPLEILQ